MYSNALEYFSELTRKLGYVRDFDSALEVFMILDLHQQIIFLVIGFGILVGIFIMLIAIFTDNHE
jgi:hypothetical protein